MCSTNADPPIGYNTRSIHSSWAGGWKLDENTVKLISGALAVLCVVIIIMRRKSKKKDTQQDDF